MEIGEYNNHIKRKSYIWNFIATAINASEAVLVLAVASRIVSLDDVGILTFGFVIANLMLCISKYGVRNFQVSDVNYQYSFKDYLLSRILTISFAGFATIIFAFFSVLFNDYNFIKLFSILVIIFIYQIEAFEDVFLAELQRKGRLDIGAMLFSFRWLITIFVWIIGLVTFKDILISSVISFAFDLIIASVSCGYLYKLIKKKEIWNKKRAFKILKECLPLCVMLTLSIYIPNAAKYAIENFMNESIQAIYGYISMPIFVLDVVSFVIFQPLLLEISQDWNKERYKLIINKLIKLSFLICIISLAYIFFSYFAGIPLLSILYGLELSDYKQCFMILVCGSIALAFLGMFISVLTIMRKQTVTMFVYLIVSIALFVLVNIVFSDSDIIIISIINVLCIVMLTIMLGLLMFITLLNKIKG